MDGPDQGRNVLAELGELLVFVRDGLLQPGDLGSEPDLDVRWRSFLLDALVELVLKIEMPLGESVSGDVGLVGEGDDGEGATGVLRGIGKDPVHGGPDAVAFVGGG